MAAPVTGAGTIDGAALDAALREKLDWRFKSVPSALWGLSIAEAAARTPRLFDSGPGGFLGPVITLESEALEHNLRTMARWCAGRGLALAPHGKTTMAPQLFARQLERGAWGITAANASQLRVYRAFGVSRVLLANQLIDPAGLAWLAGELDRDPGFEFCCWADSVAGVELMTAALRECGARRPVDVLVELGGDPGRTGARGLASALTVATAIRDSPVLRLAGAGGYEGAVAHGADPAALSTVDAYLGELRTLALTLAEDGLVEPGGPVIVTAGGSAYFDRVAEAFTGWPAGLDVLPILRSGGYLTHDDGFYRDFSPLGEHPRLPDVPPLRPALRAWAQVSSRPTAELALLTMGKRDVSFDEGLPEPQLLRRPGAAAVPLTGHRLRKLNDQHAFLELAADSPVRIGDWVGMGISHPCTVFDKWPLIPLLAADGEHVIDLIRTYF